MDAARTFEARQTKRSSVGVATAFGEVQGSRPQISLSWENLCLGGLRDLVHVYVFPFCRPWFDIKRPPL